MNTAIGLLLGLGTLWVLLIALLPLFLIICVAYSIYTLRKPEGWEEK